MVPSSNGAKHSIKYFSLHQRVLLTGHGWGGWALMGRMGKGWEAWLVGEGHKVCNMLIITSLPAFFLWLALLRAGGGGLFFRVGF